MIAASAVQKQNPTRVFHAHGLSKTYHMGEVDVHALRDVDLDIFRGRVRCACSGHRVRESRRC